ncbi:MAG: helix-turn-helix transcriptional regulator [Planctomycetales bacterium]|nr:helix-turn-helix transcriptional regulator [Planctomycetales bacterium]
MPVKRECLYEECPVEAALDLIGGKWKTMIVALLLAETLRFNELERRLKGVTHRVLSAQLKDLESTGVVRRDAYAEIPPRVEYSLTPLGRSLEPLIAELRRWGEEFALEARRKACVEPQGRSVPNHESDA